MSAQYELFVARDKRNASRFCIGSTLCLSALEYLPDDFVVIRNCDDMSKSSFPTWLIGTPTLVSTSGTDIFRGQQAVKRLQQAVVSYTEHVTTQRLLSKTTPQRGKTQPSSNRPSVPPASQPLLPPSTNPQQPSKTRPNAGDEDDEELSELWSTRIPDDGEDDDGEISRKITSDDLARAVAHRQQTTQAPSSQLAPPPPPPPSEKD